MTILTAAGFVISGCLFLLGGALIIYGSYISYKEFNSLRSTTPAKVITKYLLSGAASMGLGAFFLFTTAVGFSWENVSFSVFMALIILGLGGLDNFIRLWTARFLNRRK